jgi:hypothetical protein
VTHCLDQRRVERSAGRTPAHAWAAVLAAQEDLAAMVRPRSALPVDVLVADYLRQHAGRWDARTVHDRGTDLRVLARFGAGVACHRLDCALLQRAVVACGTPRPGEFIRRRLRHLLRWGVKLDYLSDDQLALIDRVEWARPDGWRDAPTRRVLAARAGLAEVPGIDWVRRFALACGAQDPHGQGSSAQRSPVTAASSPHGNSSSSSTTSSCCPPPAAPARPFPSWLFEDRRTTAPRRTRPKPVACSSA